MSEEQPFRPGTEQVPASDTRGEAPLPVRRSRLGLVPADYAEKTMNSLLSLHEGLMAEKERALDLTHRLTAAQQDRAELEAYVRLLEVELSRQGGPTVGAARETGPNGTQAAMQTLLRALAMPAPSPASAPVSPPAPATPATRVSIPTVSRGPRPTSTAAPTPLIASADPLTAAPRPPRPSAAYRAPTPARGDEPNALTPEADHESSALLATDESWRQW